MASGDDASFSSGTITITIDGEATPAIQVRTPLFFCAEYLPNGGAAANHYGRYIQLTQGGSGWGVCFKHPIPFGTSAVITLTNGSTGSSMTWWYIVEMVVGVPKLWRHTRKLWCVSNTLTGQTVNTAITLASATSLNPGRLLGVYMSIDSTPGSASPSTGPLEGTIQIFCDGGTNPNYQSSGTEDYFQSAFYFENIPSGAALSGEYVGYTFIGSGQNTWNLYRWHILEPIIFTNGLKYVWNCGNSSYVNFTGGVRFAYCLWYYTE
jgi:hypothetical protein